MLQQNRTRKSTKSPAVSVGIGGSTKSSLFKVAIEDRDTEGSDDHHENDHDHGDDMYSDSDQSTRSGLILEGTPPLPDTAGGSLNTVLQIGSHRKTTGGSSAQSAQDTNSTNSDHNYMRSPNSAKWTSSSHYAHRSKSQQIISRSTQYRRRKKQSLANRSEPAQRMEMFDDAVPPYFDRDSSMNLLRSEIGNGFPSDFRSEFRSEIGNGFRSESHHQIPGVPPPSPPGLLRQNTSYFAYDSDGRGFVGYVDGTEWRQRRKVMMGNAETYVPSMKDDVFSIGCIMTAILGGESLFCLNSLKKHLLGMDVISGPLAKLPPAVQTAIKGKRLLHFVKCLKMLKF